MPRKTNREIADRIGELINNIVEDAEDSDNPTVAAWYGQIVGLCEALGTTPDNLGLVVELPPSLLDEDDVNEAAETD